MSEILRKLKESKEREDAELASKAAAKASKAAKHEGSHLNDEGILQDDQTGELYIVDDRAHFASSRLNDNEKGLQEDQFDIGIDDSSLDEGARLFGTKNEFYEGPTSESKKPKSSSGKEITIDTLRGLYWMATLDHVGDKKTPRGPLKRKLNDLLLTKEGMRTLLKSLEEYVFS